MTKAIPEKTFDLSIARHVCQADLDAYGFTKTKAFWCEWSHPLEQSRSFAGMLNAYTDVFNWNKFIKPGGTCVDVGAHSGDTSIPMAILSADPQTGMRGTVIAVEPNPHVFPLLELNVALNNHLSNFRSVRLAITQETVDSIEIFDSGTAYCNCGVIDQGFSDALKDRLSRHAGSSFTVPGRRLETICTELLNRDELDKLCFVKTDCEGYDKEILRASKDFLAHFRPVIFTEWYAYFTPDDDRDFFAAIDEIGYIALDPITLRRATIEKRSDDVILVHASEAFWAVP